MKDGHLNGGEAWGKRTGEGDERRRGKEWFSGRVFASPDRWMVAVNNLKVKGNFGIFFEKVLEHLEGST